MRNSNKTKTIVIGIDSGCGEYTNFYFTGLGILCVILHLTSIQMGSGVWDLESNLQNTVKKIENGKQKIKIPSSHFPIPISNVPTF